MFYLFSKQTKIFEAIFRSFEAPWAGFMNRRRLCQLTAAILTSDTYVGFMKRHSDYHATIQRRVDPIRWTRAWR